MKTAILGGGLTGVTLARLLKERGQDVVILERDAHYGGLCRSQTEQGFTFDSGGSHIIFSRDREVLHFMHRVLDRNKDSRHRNTKILHQGRYIKYPFENGLHELDSEECFTCITEFIQMLIAVEKGVVPQPRNFREWMYYTFGKGIAELYLIPYNEKIWKYPSDKMSCHWVEGRIPRPPVEDIIRSAIGIETEGYLHQVQFAYPVEGGIEAMIHAIAEPIKRHIMTEFEVTSIREDGGKYCIGNRNQHIVADRCISTIPLHHLIHCLEGVPPLVRRACENLRYNSLYCVFLGIKGQVPDFSWVYIPDPATGLFNRLSFPSNYSNRVTPPGHSSVLVEITFHRGDEVDRMTEKELRDHVISSLLQLKIISSESDVVYSAVKRQEYAYVIYDLDYLHNISIVKQFCSSRGIGLVGRFSQFEYLNMDGCIRNAMDFVEKHL